MICSKCQKDNASGAIFCGYCGGRMPSINDIVKVAKDFYENNEENIFKTLKLLRDDYHIEGDEANSIIEKIKKMQSLKNNTKNNKSNDEIDLNKVAKDFLIDNDGNVEKAIKYFIDDVKMSQFEAEKLVNNAYDSIINPHNKSENQSKPIEQKSEEQVKQDIILDHQIKMIKEEERKEREEEYNRINRPNDIKQVQIVNVNSKKGVVSTASRGIVGSLIAGPGGLLIGAMTGKNIDKTTFLVTYNDGSTKIKTVKNGSYEYDKLIKHIK